MTRFLPTISLLLALVGVAAQLSLRVGGVAISYSQLAYGAQVLQAEAPSTQPVIYDSLVGYQRPPAGLSSSIVNGSQLFRDGDRSRPDYWACWRFGRANATKDLIVVNIEHWPTDIRRHTATEVADSVYKLRLAVEWVKRGAESAVAAGEIDKAPPVGLYSMVPLRDYWSPVTGNPAEVARWKLANEAIRDLVKSVDVICPSLYTFYADRAGWRTYAAANIAEAEQYGKPVVAFLWPRFHSSHATLGLQFLPPDYLAMQIELCRELGVDVVLWDWAGFGTTLNGLPREPDAAWWDAVGGA